MVKTRCKFRGPVLQRLSERHSHFPAAAEAFDRHVEHILSETKTDEQADGFGFGPL